MGIKKIKKPLWTEYHVSFEWINLFGIGLGISLGILLYQLFLK